MKLQRATEKLPKSLYGRAALIVLLPITGLLLIASLVFIQRHYEDVTSQMSSNVVLDLSFLLGELNEAETLDAAKEMLPRVAGALQFEVEIPNSDSPATDLRHVYDLSGKVVIETLRKWNPQIQAIDLKSQKHRVRLWMPTGHGPMFVSFGRNRVSASNPHQFLVLMFFSGIIMALVTLTFLRNQLRPIRSLARAATAFGKGQTVPFKPSGAIEIRQAGNAFLDMRRRIERHIDQRTNVLSGVSHDLRTPITRLRLGLSMLDDTEEVRELLRDVEEMRLLVEEFLSFVRDGAFDESTDTDIAEIVRAVVEKGAKTGGNISLEQGSGPCMVKVRPLSLTRALDNLINNALRYGNRVSVGLSTLQHSVVITVEDDGPGIPPEQRKDAVEPFVRLDTARNQNRGVAAGLGLAITNDVARQHGGTLELSQSKTLGGLKASLVLPR